MNQFFCLFLMLLTFNVFGSYEQNELRSFTSDGCSMSPDKDFFIGNGDWLNCCYQHDIKYWLGGTRQDKKIADENFKQCLIKSGMSDIETEAYYLAVVYGGSAYLPTSWKWGYGWKKSRGYAPLTRDELEQAKPYKKLFNLPVKVKSASPFLLIARGDPNLEDYLNFCEMNMLKQIQQMTGIKNKRSFKIIKLDSTNGGGDSYQIFSNKCKGGYFFVEFDSNINRYSCMINEKYAQKDIVEKIEAYGECESLVRSN